MPIEFKFPDVGEGIEEAEIVRWLVKEGDKIEEHQDVVEVETDKAVVKIPSPVAGRIEKRMFGEGATIHVGDVLFTIAGEGKVAPAEPAKHKSVSVVGRLEEEEQEVMAAPPTAGQSAKGAAPILTTPAVRRLAKELGVELASVTGTGPQGRIVEEDVRKVAESRKPSAPAKPADDTVQHIPLRGIRKTIARNLTHSYLTAVHVTHCDQADATALVRVREERKAEAANAGVRLTYLSFIVKAVVAALKKHPYLNASLDDAKEEIVLKSFYNIGIALDTPDGLMVPVVKNADQLSLFALAKEIERLATAGRDRKLQLDEFKGGTFTITNVGALGGIFATPIINHPECAILGLGKIADRAVVRDGAVVARKTLPLSLSFDHRIVDGAEAARFTNDIIAALENPASLI